MDAQPVFALGESGRDRLRRRLGETHRRGEFPLLDRFADEGATDYVAFATRVDARVRLGEGQGLVSSWMTAAPGGFSESEVDLFADILPTLALAFMLWTTNRTARTAITTYLGGDAAERVLGGNIVRGRATPISAVVWFSDLVNFTRIADAVAPGDVLALLNDYAEAQVEAIEANGGHVLKFIGDGILAIFPDDGSEPACARALDAAADHRRRIAALNERRAAARVPVTSTHLALHLGELLYGNVGSPRRLDFTVLGPAVNEAARIEALCMSLDQAVIVSSAFAERIGRRAFPAGEPRPLRDEGSRPAAGIVHARSGVNRATPLTSGVMRVRETEPLFVDAPSCGLDPSALNLGVDAPALRVAWSGGLARGGTCRRVDKLLQARSASSRLRSRLR